MTARGEPLLEARAPEVAWVQIPAPLFTSNHLSFLICKMDPQYTDLTVLVDE